MNVQLNSYAPLEYKRRIYAVIGLVKYSGFEVQFMEQPMSLDSLLVVTNGEFVQVNERAETYLSLHTTELDHTEGLIPPGLDKWTSQKPDVPFLPYGKPMGDPTSERAQGTRIQIGYPLNAWNPEEAAFTRWGIKPSMSIVHRR